MYGEYLQRARERAGLSRADAAALMGKTPDAIRKIEVNDNAASLDTLDKMAAAYGCLIGDLLPNSGAGHASDRFEPLMAALMGLDDEEIEDQILILAAQARLNRNGILRRAHRPTPSRVAERGRELPARPRPSGEELDLVNLLTVDRSAPPKASGDEARISDRRTRADRR